MDSSNRWLLFQKIIQSILSIAIGISLPTKLLTSWSVKLIDTRSSTYKTMRLVDVQYVINGNQPLMKRCSSSLESLSKWGWYKCRNWSTTGAVVNCMVQISFEILCRERSLNYFSNFGIFRTTITRIRTKTGCSSWNRSWIYWEPDFHQCIYLVRLSLSTKLW